jgi:hypothetical protein
MPGISGRSDVFGTERENFQRPYQCALFGRPIAMDPADSQGESPTSLFLQRNPAIALRRNQKGSISG